MKGKYIAGSGGEGTAAVIEIAGEQFECMDCLRRRYKRGDVVHVTFHAGLFKEDRRGQVEIGANPEQVKILQELGGWRYRAYGRVIAVGHETILDCGVINIELNMPSDASMLDTYLMVEIQRLECYRARAS